MMQKKNTNESWYYNRSERDIVVAELDLTLRAKKVVNLYKIKPSLRSEYVRYSERFGVLAKRTKSGDLLKLDGPPVASKEIAQPKYIEATEPLVTRVRSCIEIDPGEKDFIENLESDFLNDRLALDDHKRSLINDRFIEEVDMDGFIDPLAEDLD